MRRPFFGALAVSQVLNVMLLVGERKVVARAGHFDHAIERMALEASRLPPFTRRDLPMPLLNGKGFKGAIFLSERNRAAQVQDGRAMSRYEPLLAAALASARCSRSRTLTKTRLDPGPDIVDMASLGLVPFKKT